ncbi:MAG: type II toxin-antitoxin system YafQ family toxin [Candidatus Omnitrophica bacterium]|nr:type II toxin-antitoxin system YafQ family toxin [Candidatus Omnitrophota bacterium]
MRQFQKDVRLAKKRGKDIHKLKIAIDLLIEGQVLPGKLKDHSLRGNFVDYRECHLEPDWLLIYKETPWEIYFVRTGTHSDLFR